MSVVDVARGWVGRNFNPGEREQCAAFVRSVFAQADIPLGVATRPSDWRQTAGLPQGPGLANSFAGDDVGELVPRLEQLAPGDVVMFCNTYGDYPAGTITHVGIYVGGGEFVHRPTAARPVEKAALAGYWADVFAEGRRIPGVTPGAKKEDLLRVKVFAHGGRVRVYHRGREVKATEIKVFVHDGKLGVALNNQTIQPTSLTLELAYHS